MRDYLDIYSFFSVDIFFTGSADWKLSNLAQSKILLDHDDELKNEKLY